MADELDKKEERDSSYECDFIDFIDSCEIFKFGWKVVASSILSFVASNIVCGTVWNFCRVLFEYLFI